MKNNKKWFTLIEIIITITTLTVLFLLCFWLIMFINENNERNKSHLTLQDKLNELKDEFYNKKWLSIAFYDYEQLNNWINTSYELENKFRKDLKYVIEKSMSSYLGSNYTLDSLNPCYEIYDMSLVNEKDLFNYKNFWIDECNESIKSFWVKNNILVITNKKKLTTNIYLVFKYDLYRIDTTLDKDLTNDDILIKNINDITVNKLTNNILVTSFKWYSYNKCLDQECIFYDFTSNEKISPWLLDISLLKINIDNDWVYFPTSYLLEDLININTK